MKPHLLFSDNHGKIFDHPDLLMAVFDGKRTRLPEKNELITLPQGSDIFLLPGRSPAGIDPENGKTKILTDVTAVSVFPAPAYLRLAHPAFKRRNGCCVLPLFAYAPVGMYRNIFYTAAVRIDRNKRQDPMLFDMDVIEKKVSEICRKMKNNRLTQHLSFCALSYGCRAAQNFFLGRFECPLPTSPTCNSKCPGCISSQDTGLFRASHERIAFVPYPEEIAEVAVFHSSRVDKPVFSFGQGCEGEPLQNWEILEQSIRLIRKKTKKGTINLNTNGSLPFAVERLFRAGLDSIRLTIVSAREQAFRHYHASESFDLNSLLRCAGIAHEHKGFVSLNYLVFPGWTDLPEEMEKMEKIIEKYEIDMIQMRNLNIDPDFFMDKMKKFISGSIPLGLRTAMQRFRKVRRKLRFGYFNPPIGQKDFM
jgi:pyruvate-formate lyase-activating enzyme